MIWRSCNDNGPGGVCTRCGRLHTVTIVAPCIRCGRAVAQQGDEYCGACYHAMDAGNARLTEYLQELAL